MAAPAAASTLNSPSPNRRTRAGDDRFRPTQRGFAGRRWRLHGRKMVDAAGSVNARGDWSPSERVSYSPLFVLPLKPTKVLHWLVGYPGYVLPYNALYFVVAAIAWGVATPSRPTMSSWSPRWIAPVLLRNAAVLVAWYGLFHLRLYGQRKQDAKFKYNPKWPAAKSDRFTFGSQLRENVFWTLASGLPIWTAWEVATLWLMARGTLRSISWAQHHVWFVAWMLPIPLWREVHFYTTHRLIHWPPLYKAIHSLHHRNTNPGPWSGFR
jgi:hypothetical protein